MKYQQMKFEPIGFYRDWHASEVVKVKRASFLAGVLFTILSIFIFSVIFLQLSPGTFVETFFWFLIKSHDIGLW